MKFLFRTLIILIITFFTLKFAIFFFNNGHETSNNIGNFNIKENLQVNENNNYYFQITHEDFNLNFQINKNFNKDENVISKIQYQNIDGYECILPIFKGNEILTDIMCLKDNTITYAHDLNNDKLNEFQEELRKYGYNKEDFQDNADPVNLSNTQTLYKDNLLENHYIAMESYKGLNLFNSDTSVAQIFENDVYKKPISLFYDKYYIVADYSDEYAFKYFYVVNIINGTKTEIRSYDEISFDSYIQGAVDNDIYLFDPDARVQYKISLEYETVEQVGNKDNIKYYNGTWTTMTLNEALSGKKFDNYYTDEIEGYSKVDKIGDKTGYYYMYEQIDNGYNVYRADIQNKNLRTYLFTTTNINSVIYLEDAIYYQNNNDFNYYNNKGNRKIITNTELQFNDDINLGVYKND